MSDNDFPKTHIFSPEGKDKLIRRLDFCADLLDDLVVIGGSVQKICFEYGDPNTGTSLYYLYNQLLELVHGASSLARSGNAQTCRVVARSTLEISAYIIYITNNNTNKLCKAYIVNQAMNSYGAAIAMDPKSKEWEEINKIAQAEHGKQFEEPSPDIREASLEEFRSLRNDKRYKSIFDEWDRTFASKKYRGINEHIRKWYMLWNGPKSFRELCESIGWLTEHDGIYSSLSANTHGQRPRLTDTGKPCKIGVPVGILHVCGLIEVQYRRCSDAICAKCSDRHRERFRNTHNTLLAARVRQLHDAARNEALF